MDYIQNDHLYQFLDYNDIILSIVIPIFNESKGIIRFLGQIPKNDRTEIIIVDDGSSDGTPDIIKDSNIEVKLLLHEKNEGYTKALLTGLKHAKGDIILTLDICEDYNPNHFLELLNPIIESKADIVIGSRYIISRYKEKITRKFPQTNILINKIIEKFFNFIFGLKITNTQSGFRAYTRDSLEIFKKIDGFPVRFYIESLINAISLNYNILEVPITKFQTYYEPYLFNKLKVILNILIVIGKYFLKRYEFKKIRKYRKSIEIVKEFQKDIKKKRENKQYQNYRHLQEINDTHLKHYVARSQNIEISREKAKWRFGPIKMQRFEFEQIDSKKTFSFVKLALNDPKLKKILKKRIRFSAKNDKEIYKLINSLPKIDLHCHLGGCARINDLYKIANTYPNDSTLNREIEDFFRNNNIDLDTFFNKNPRNILKEIFSLNDINSKYPEHIASIIKYLFRINKLDKLNNIYKKRLESGEYISLIENDRPNNYFFGVGLKEYLQFGDWGGSALLQTKDSLKEAISCLCSFAKEHNVKYLELRFNPLAYSEKDLSGKQVFDVIREAVICYREDIIINFIFIIGKPKRDTVNDKISFKKNLLEIVDLILKICNEQRKMNLNQISKFFPKLVGLDLAGIEDYFNFYTNYGWSNIIDSIKDDIKPLATEEIFITIHCGETNPPSDLSKREIESWNNMILDIIHYLNPDRLGHALNVNDSTMLNKIAKSKITIELCPSSNCQISKFKRTPWIFETNDNKNLDLWNSNFREYPLKKYLKNNLKISINTDNPGISKTDWTNEIFVASELHENNLSIEEIIELIYNALESSFFPKKLQEELKSHLNEEIERILLRFHS